ncbi:MAG: hypothetical protein IKO91_00460 [Oscillospiraceae bacterium]|nr:hypothetical protein [Oscillospiraceae bacterium]
MAKCLKQEVFILFRRWPALLLILAALIGSCWLGSTQPIGTEKYDRHIDAKSYWLFSRGEFRRQVLDGWLLSSFSRKSLEEVTESYGLEDAGIQSLEEIYPLTAKAQYVRLLWFAGGLIFLCAVLPAALIRYPLDTGFPAMTAGLVKSRRRVALAEIAVFFLTALLLSLISLLVQIALFAGSIVSQAGFAYFLYTLLLRLLMDLAVLSIPMYLAFRIRRMSAVIVLNAAYGCLCYALNVLASRWEGVIPIPLPAFLHGLRALWQPNGPGLWIAFSALVSLGFIVLFTSLSLRCFERS